MQNRRINILLQMKSRHHQESLSALLTAVPGIQVQRYGDPIPFTLMALDRYHPDILLLESSITTSADTGVIQSAHRIWPNLKTVLLVDPIHPTQAVQSDMVDVILPVNTTAGDLLHSIKRLAGSFN
jgi:hypothetical protein